jgi:hypothetical protein
LFIQHRLLRLLVLTSYPPFGGSHSLSQHRIEARLGQEDIFLAQ